LQGLLPRLASIPLLSVLAFAALTLAHLFTGAPGRVRMNAVTRELRIVQ
jgi:hypothetical protein